MILVYYGTYARTDVYNLEHEERAQTHGRVISINEIRTNYYSFLYLLDEQTHCSFMQKLAVLKYLQIIIV